jgi:hypothetical protein
MHSAAGQPSSADAAARADISSVGGGSNIVDYQVHQILGEFSHEWVRRENPLRSNGTHYDRSQTFS